MSTYKPARRDTFEYDFIYRGTRYRGNTLQTTKVDADRAEHKIKEALRQKAAGIHVPERDDSPRFQHWAGVFLTYMQTRIDRPDALAAIIPVILRFWGDEPPAVKKPDEDAPRHDLRLVDPIQQPRWIVDFEAWMTQRGLSNQSKNHYRGLLRRMYRVALLPEFRAQTGVTVNPFVGVPNDPTTERTVVLEPKQLQAWIAHASYHVRLATSIAALSAKLRLRNVLDLQWARHFEPDPRTTKFNPRIAHYITLDQHKTAKRTKRPLVAVIPKQLLTILKDAWQRQQQTVPKPTHVVVYHGAKVKSIRGGVKGAVEAAGLAYGRDTAGGATFHTIRHSIATLLSDDEADPLKLMDAMGHGDLRTTLKYRHMKPERQRPAIERLSRRLRFAKLVTAPRVRAARKKRTA